MPRRCNDTVPDEPPRKKNCIAPTTSSFDLKDGEFLTDITGKQWRLGKAVGVGGFGEIYLASDNLTKEVKTSSKYVAKVESHTNGPLFVEVNCYLRVAKPDMIEEWKKENNIDFLGMPHYVASGSHMHKGERYRFLILPRFDKDLELILQEKKKFNIKTVLTISSQIMDVLEYIHSKGYIHSDIKASNILLSNQNNSKEPSTQPNRIANLNPFRACRIRKTNTRKTSRNLRPHSKVNYVDEIPNFEEMVDFWLPNTKTDVNNELGRKDQVYLLDYGLACKYLTSDGNHKQVCVDARKAHAGTILFCSRDAHKGITSRRSDLESLGYNIIYWLTGNLPWENDVEDPELVAKKKQKAMANIEYFLGCCFLDYPKFLLDYFRYLQNLNCQEKPDYAYCNRLFKQSIVAHGYKNDSILDFDNKQVSRLKPDKLKKGDENLQVHKFIHQFSRPPLQSNIPIKPLLRKKEKNKKLKPKSNWFEVPDPEIIIKQARERKNTENEANFNSNIADLNIERLNPTYAMIEIYNKCKERIDASPSHKGDCLENVDGYTHAMLAVLQKSKQRKEQEMLNVVVNLTKIHVKRCVNKRRKKNESPIRSPPKTRTTKSSQVIKRDHFQTKKSKAAPLRRTYSLRG